MMIDPTTLVFDDGRPWVKIDDETGCWVWQGTKTKGYGRVRVGKRGSVQAHKVIWESINGPTPREMVLGHTCSRRSCVNPLHVRPIDEPTNNSERYFMPKLSREAELQIEEYFAEDRSNLWISHEIGISVWAVRRYAERRDWRDQYTLDIGVPF